MLRNTLRDKSLRFADKTLRSAQLSENEKEEQTKPASGYAYPLSGVAEFDGIPADEIRWGLETKAIRVIWNLNPAEPMLTKDGDFVVAGGDWEEFLEARRRRINEIFAEERKPSGTIEWAPTAPR